MGLIWAEVHARRWQRHGLAAPRSDTELAAIAGDLCGAHAQIMTAAELSLGLRTETLTREGVQDSLWSDRTLIKTFGPRGTVHLLPSAELAFWTGALSAVPGGGSLPPAMRMTTEQIEQVLEAIGVALADAELTVDDLSEAVIERAGPWAGDLVMPGFQQMWPRWRQAINTAAHRGLLCAESGAQDCLYQSASLARRVHTNVDRRCARRAGPALSVGLWTRHTAAVRPLAGCPCSLGRIAI